MSNFLFICSTSSIYTGQICVDHICSCLRRATSFEINRRPVSGSHQLSEGLLAQHMVSKRTDIHGYPLVPECKPAIYVYSIYIYRERERDIICICEITIMINSIIIIIIRSADAVSCEHDALDTRNLLQHD